jgi:hypothetical protein
MLSPAPAVRTHSRNYPGSLVIGLVLLATAIVTLAGAIAAYDVPTHAVLWGSMALAAYAAALLFLTTRKDADDLGLARWKLGPWSLVWYGLTSGLASVIWIEPQTGTSAEITIVSILRALWLVAIGMTFWAIGYSIGGPVWLRRFADRGVTALRSRRRSTVRGPLTPWVLYAIGMAARIITAITTGRFGYVGNPASANTATGYQQILVYAGDFCPLAVCAAALQVYRERLASARITLAVLFIIEVTFGALEGGKGSFITAVLAMAMPLSAARCRMPKKAMIAAAVIFFIAVIPFNSVYRQEVRDGPALLSTSQAINGAPTILTQQLNSQRGLLANFSGSWDYLLQRLQEIEGPAIILQRTPAQIPFVSFTQLLDGPLLEIVPRAIWPSKPIINTGYDFSSQYYDTSSYTAAAMSPVGDLYRHGGWLAVMAGMLVLGCCVRMLDDVLDIRANPHAIFLLLLLIPSVVEAEGSWVSLVAGMPVTVLIGMVAVAITFRKTSAR